MSELALPCSASIASQQRSVAAWLIVCCACVFAMVVVGGVTRLTHSGLSIVEWQPIVGTLPPLDHAQWEEAFAKYRQTPEYREVNRGMTLEAFKGIFWWEYFHRLLARTIGVIFLVPLLVFVARGRIDRSRVPRLAGIFVLGGLQGALGWYMVKSGLVDDPRVSQYRLTAHLGMAVLIYGAMFWLALDLLHPRRIAHHDARVARLRRLAALLAPLVLVIILTGGLVAGIRAGFAYNTFPSMNGHVVPPEILMLEPWYRNFFYNMATVQFDHRFIAWLLALLVPVFWWRVMRHPAAPRAARLGAHAMLAMLAVQVALGIATLVLRVPVPLAALHQAGAVLLFASALCVAQALSR
jgi:cytochrome c oxidase assembly protein subunit 15